MTTLESRLTIICSLKWEVTSLRYNVDSCIQAMQDSLRSTDTMTAYARTITSTGRLEGRQQPSIAQEQPAGVSRTESDMKISELEDDTDGSTHGRNQIVLHRREGDQDEDLEGSHQYPSEGGPLALAPYFRTLFAQERLRDLAENALIEAQNTSMQNHPQDVFNQRQGPPLQNQDNANQEPVNISIVELEETSLLIPDSQSAAVPDGLATESDAANVASSGGSTRPPSEQGRSLRYDHVNAQTSADRLPYRPGSITPQTSTESSTEANVTYKPPGSQPFLGDLSQQRSRTSIQDLSPTTRSSTGLMTATSGRTLVREGTLQRPDIDVLNVCIADQNFVLPFRVCPTYDVS
jgi:hypothetical protein